jgi:hypothetical protein
VKTFKTDLVDATPAHLKAAQAFVEDVVAHGQVGKYCLKNPPRRPIIDFRPAPDVD